MSSCFAEVVTVHEVVCIAASKSWWRESLHRQHSPQRNHHGHGDCV